MPRCRTATPHQATYADQRLDRIRDLIDQIIADSHTEEACQADADTVARWALDLAANVEGLDQHLTYAKDPRLPAGWARASHCRWSRLGRRVRSWTSRLRRRRAS